MYHHVKKLMYTVRVDEPDPAFGNMLLEQFGGANATFQLVRFGTVDFSQQVVRDGAASSFGARISMTETGGD
jgi:hypothetical protein